jgi:glycosyltransferase involved in cell wall biosynthesis
MSAGFEPGFRGGGPIRSLAGIVDTVGPDTEIYLVTRDRDLGTSQPYPELSGRWVGRGNSRIYYLNVSRPRHWIEVWRRLAAIEFDLLYVNSLWDPLFTAIPVSALRLRLIRARRVLIAPRGELASGALSVKGWKKRLFLKRWLSFLRGMHPIWHAASDLEAAQIRSVAPDAHIEVMQNPVTLPVEPILPGTEGQGPTRVVFIGRISPVKNLHSALEALETVSKPLEFDIYGPIEDAGYWAKCQGILKRMPAHVQVRYRGELAPRDVRPTFAQYDAFIFPTLGENFGHIVAESLSASCPVVCADTTPWTEVLRSGGGTVLPGTGVSDFAKLLEQLASLSSQERLRAKQRAGDEYRKWRARIDRRNILEQARFASASE